MASARFSCINDPPGHAGQKGKIIMSILIRSLHPPKTCEECGYRRIREIYELCPAYKEPGLVCYRKYSEKREEGCPLEEVADEVKQEETE